MTRALRAPPPGARPAGTCSSSRDAVVPADHRLERWHARDAAPRGTRRSSRRVPRHRPLESCPDTSSCRSRQHLPYLGPCKPWGLPGPLGRFAVLRGAALRRVNGDPFAACAAQATPRASLPALSAVGTSFVRLIVYPGPRTCARDRTTLTCAAGRPASLRTQRRRGWRAQTLRTWLIPAGSLASVLVPTHCAVPEAGQAGLFRRITWIASAGSGAGTAAFRIGAWRSRCAPN